MSSLEKIPVTILTGFLGAGKTTLIRNLILKNKSKKLAVIINEFGDLGVDGEIVKQCSDETCPEENILELANGCICCTCLLYTSPSPRDRTRSRMPSSA